MLLEKPQKKDGINLYNLVAGCPPLDLNSKYAYYLVSTHFKDTSIIARDLNNSAKTAGMISAYTLPDNPQMLFVWQVAVLPEYRGQGLAAKMLNEIIIREALAHVRYLYTTISPDNNASMNLFLSFAKKIGAKVEKELFLQRSDFVVTENSNEENCISHDDEIGFKIGPIDAMKIMQFKYNQNKEY